MKPAWECLFDVIALMAGETLMVRRREVQSEPAHRPNKPSCTGEDKDPSPVKPQDDSSNQRGSNGGTEA